MPKSVLKVLVKILLFLSFLGLDLQSYAHHAHPHPHFKVYCLQTPLPLN
jgi:hypothetical protein